MKRDATARVEFRNTSLPLEALVYPSDEYPGWWIVKVIFRGPDRDSGFPGTFATTIRFKHSRHPGRARLAQWVRMTARRFLLHELDEALHIDDVRIFDPHKTKRARRVVSR